MVRCLEQPGSGAAPRCSVVQRILHEPPPNALVLNAWGDRERADPGDRRSLIEEIAAYHLAVELRHDRIEARVRRKPESRSAATSADGKSPGKPCRPASDRNAS